MLVNLKIGQRLILLLVFITIATLAILNRLELLSELFVKMYNHPFTVSNAVLRVDRGIIKIHRSMKDVALAESMKDVQKAKHVVDDEEGRILKDFDIISERFLGDRKMYEDAIKAFREWRSIRDEVIRLMHYGRKSQAAAITKGKGARHVEKLNKAMLALNEFAQDKAVEFLVNANATSRYTFHLAYFFVLLTMMLGIIFVYFFSRSIVIPILELRSAAAEIGEGNLDVEIDIKSENEVGKLAESFNKMVTDLKNKTIELDRYHDRLELLVKERTAELAKYRDGLELLVEERTANLETVNEELKNFAYVVSHDLKAPLRGIAQISHFLSDDYSAVLDKNGRDMVDLIGNRVKRMHNLIDGILQYSRVGHIKEEKKHVDINALLKDIIVMIALPNNLKAFVDSDLPVIFFEKTRIEQVFQNLLSNAIKFTNKPAAEIRIKCADDGKYWKFSVSDNGIGIEKKHYERIFRIFQTLKPRDEEENTGVGLSIVKKIIESNNGKIWVESEAGKGSTFFFTLPKDNERVVKVERRKKSTSS